MSIQDAASDGNRRRLNKQPERGGEVRSIGDVLAELLAEYGIVLSQCGAPLDPPSPATHSPGAPEADMQAACCH